MNIRNAGKAPTVNYKIFTVSCRGQRGAFDVYSGTTFISVGLSWKDIDRQGENQFLSNAFQLIIYKMPRQTSRLCSKQHTTIHCQIQLHLYKNRYTLLPILRSFISWIVAWWVLAVKSCPSVVISHTQCLAISSRPHYHT